MFIFINNLRKCILFILAISAGFESILSSQELEVANLLPLTGDVFGKDIGENTHFPRNFRTAQDAIGDLPEFIRLDGLEDLLIAGTAQFTEEQLLAILKQLGKKTLVVDLREETHLIFEDIHGKQIPITAYSSQNLANQGKSVTEIQRDVKLYKNFILQQTTLALYYTINSEVQLHAPPLLFEVGKVYAEWEIVDKANSFYAPGVAYLLMPITDHKNPSPQSVDTFLAFLETVKDDRELVLLFHCQAGRGRTGLFMIMKDMIQNARKYNLSLHDILKRQELLGSPDFSKIKLARAENTSERYKFLQHFYEFVIAEDGLNARTPYSLWIQERKGKQADPIE